MTVGEFVFESFAFKFFPGIFGNEAWNFVVEGGANLTLESVYPAHADVDVPLACLI